MDYSDRKLCDRLMATDSVICRDAAKRIQDLCAQLIDAHEERDTVRTDLTDRLSEARAEIERKNTALKHIAEPTACGCKPCRGQCRSESALQIELDAIRDIAKEALEPKP